MDSQDHLILTVGNASVYYSDMVSLRPGQWLTDAVVAAFFEIFQKDQLPRSAGHHTVVLIEPSISRLISSMEGNPATIRSVLGDDHALLRSDVVVLPVNNACDHGFAGTHWSTLVVDVSNKRFIHHDSMTSQNRRPAASLAQIVSQLLGWPSAGPIQPGACPQQTNGSDCGVSVIAVAQHVLRHADPNPSSLAAVSLDQYRSDLLDLLSLEVEKAY